MAKKVVNEEVVIRKGYEVKDGKILIFGDLHISCVYEGKHINYAYDCLDNMGKIVEIVKKEKPVAVFFLGDIIGVRERNIADRQFLTRVLMFFGTLYNLCKGNVFTVRGNHDVGDFADFDMLIAMGYLKNPKYVDYKVNGNDEIRFHFVNYGEEHNELSLSKAGASNVVLGHADYYIEGVTNWYSEKKGRVELNKLKNFNGVDLVVSGHIHNPSKDIMYTDLPNGETVGLFYTGSCSRTAEKYPDCWYFTFFYNKTDNATDYSAEVFGLRTIEETFFDDKDFVNEEQDITDEEVQRRSEALSVVIEEIFASRLATGDLFGQIDKIPADADVKDLAKDYLHRAIDESK